MEKNPYTLALELAALSGDHDAIHRETERFMQAVADDFSAVTRKYGPQFTGLLICVAESFAASLRLIGDETDLAIAEQLRQKTEAVTIMPKGGKP